ncbi:MULTISPECIES: hypothetical protein [Acidiphilium]|uniref:Uncharacterized protein n=1 Tax=Acidiphilium multivorum (strain DSM 11245 / JCM 8867 / NBRC 100883 / AIU 301) TaxID=926570 RepID=F0IZP2_ACIMA|nr:MULTISPECIES: hypothetical protein [Acidiphilium]OYW11808.1 MAG: hypothetical protein B7Z59_03315 [Acidiphilium sp. 37-67-22]EGO94603.1 hypothetical protein APM_2571 [Acidiphilium sp. PM]BAJ81252.1 hypothetical protein ACMV_19050 [Acidiphilium multivorum AIU301]GAN74663.1 hypothetical protein Apmu_0201_06 [Acidiphilium multivorum AIU301]HQT72798.1 hypothetical protein [Acidiphilium sp.]
MIGSIRDIELLCSIDIEQTPESLHAHAIPEDVEIRPGDVVIVHDMPTAIGFGTRLTCARRATLRRASPIERWWVEFRSILEITELYEVGFMPLAEAEAALAAPGA